MKKKTNKKKVTVAKGKKISRAKEKKLEKKPGGSNTGKYKNVKPSDFAGKAGGTSPYSFPINNRKHAIAALAYARNAPNPQGIRNAVYKKYPDLKPKNNVSSKKIGGSKKVTPPSSSKKKYVRKEKKASK